MVSAEEQLPTRFVLRGVSRSVLAAYVLKLKKKYGNAIAKGCVSEAIRVGCVNVNTKRINHFRKQVAYCKNCGIDFKPLVDNQKYCGGRCVGMDYV